MRREARGQEQIGVNLERIDVALNECDRTTHSFRFAPDRVESDDGAAQSDGVIFSADHVQVCVDLDAE